MDPPDGAAAAFDDVAPPQDKSANKEATNGKRQIFMYVRAQAPCVPPHRPRTSADRRGSTGTHGPLRFGWLRALRRAELSSSSVRGSNTTRDRVSEAKIDG